MKVKTIKIMILSLIWAFGSKASLYSQNPPIQVSIPDTTGDAGSTIQIPIQVEDLSNRNIIAYQTNVNFDESILDAIGSSSQGTLSESFGTPTINTQQDGLISIGGFGTTALTCHMATRNAACSGSLRRFLPDVTSHTRSPASSSPTSLAFECQYQARSPISS